MRNATLCKRIIGESQDRLQPISAIDEDSSEIPRNLFKYSVDGPLSRPVGNIKLIETLGAGIYQIGSDQFGLYFKRVKAKTDDIMIFEDSPMRKVVEEIAKFWDRKAQYAKLGLLQSRGLILYGCPGSGKSIALQQVGEAMTKNGDLMLFADSPSQIAGALTSIRQIEPNRKIVVAFEEADELASYDERTLLRLMDGDMKVDQVLYLATTNHIDRISPRLQRPGRFDKRVHVGPPKFEHRHHFLTVKLKGVAEAAQITDMAKKTEGLSYGHLRELVAAGFALGDNVDEVIMRLRDSRNIKESKKKAKLTESKSSTAVNKILGQ